MAPKRWEMTPKQHWVCHSEEILWLGGGGYASHKKGDYVSLHKWRVLSKTR